MAATWTSCSTPTRRSHMCMVRGKGRYKAEIGGSCGLTQRRSLSGRCAASKLSREERDLAENVKGLLQRERVRLDRDVREANTTASSTSSTSVRGVPSTPPPPSSSGGAAPTTSPFARQSSFRSGTAADPFADAGTTRRKRTDRSSVREAIEADEATPQTEEDAKVTWIWERADAEQLVRTHASPTITLMNVRVSLYVCVVFCL